MSKKYLIVIDGKIVECPLEMVQLESEFQITLEELWDIIMTDEDLLNAWCEKEDEKEG